MVELLSRNGVWRSLVARFVRDEEAVGSNPATPTGNRRDRLVPAIFLSLSLPRARRQIWGYRVKGQNVLVLW